MQRNLTANGPANTAQKQIPLLPFPPSLSVWNWSQQFNMPHLFLRVEFETEHALPKNIHGYAGISVKKPGFFFFGNLEISKPIGTCRLQKDARLV